MFARSTLFISISRVLSCVSSYICFAGGCCAAVLFTAMANAQDSAVPATEVIAAPRRDWLVYDYQTLIAGVLLALAVFSVLYFGRKQIMLASINNMLAIVVTIFSFCTLLFLLWGAQRNNFIKADGQFNAALGNYHVQLIGLILPVLGTWLGTVFAFYFARENFKAAEQAFMRPDRQPRRIASDFMVPLDKLVIVKNSEVGGEEETWKSYPLKKIGEMLRSNSVRRAIFLKPDGTASYILHEETLNRALATKLPNNSPTISEDTTFSQFLEYPSDLPASGMKTMGSVMQCFRSISRSGTAFECMKMFEKEPFLQNILVTETGDKVKEKPLGLITRDTLGEAAAGMSEATR